MIYLSCATGGVPFRYGDREAFVRCPRVAVRARLLPPLFLRAVSDPLSAPYPHGATHGVHRGKFYRRIVGGRWVSLVSWVLSGHPVWNGTVLVPFRVHRL